MPKSEANPKLNAFFAKAKTWREELARLRALLLGSGLAEELKWGKPCYTWEGGNVVILLPLKAHCALVLAKGALFKDPHGLLVKPGENTQAARQIRLTSLADIAGKEAAIKAILRQAIAAEKAGLEVEYKKITEHAMPGELQDALRKNAALKTAFAALTPGRQRAYYIFISGAKQAATRAARVAKCAPLILAGKGLNERPARAKA